MDTNYFDVAVQAARRQRDTVVGEACSVLVVFDGGTHRFARATADVFTTDDTLTISSLDTDDPIRTFSAGTWTEALVYGMDGQTDFALVPERAL